MSLQCILVSDKNIQSCIRIITVTSNVSIGQGDLVNTFFFKGFDNLLVCANLTESDLDSLEVTQPGVR